MSGVENIGGGFLESSNYDNQGGNQSQSNRVCDHLLIFCSRILILILTAPFVPFRQKLVNRLCDLSLLSNCWTASNHTENQNLRLIMLMLLRYAKKEKSVTAICRNCYTDALTPALLLYKGHICCCHSPSIRAVHERGVHSRGWNWLYWRPSVVRSGYPRQWIGETQENTINVCRFESLK
jgi:hypothetical protein